MAPTVTTPTSTSTQFDLPEGPPMDLPADQTADGPADMSADRQ